MTQPYIPIIRMIAGLHGEAAKTYGAMLFLMPENAQETYVSADKIASVSGTSTKTVYRHLQTLVDAGCLIRLGHRANKKSAQIRRTVTYRLTTTKSEIVKFPHFRLPVAKIGSLKEWSQAVTYSLICWRCNNGCSGRLSDPKVGKGRTYVTKMTGLSKRQSEVALKKLQESGLIGYCSESYQVIIPPATEGHIHVPHSAEGVTSVSQGGHVGVLGGVTSVSHEGSHPCPRGVTSVSHNIKHSDLKHTDEKKEDIKQTDTNQIGVGSFPSDFSLWGIITQGKIQKSHAEFVDWFINEIPKLSQNSGLFQMWDEKDNEEVLEIAIATVIAAQCGESACQTLDRNRAGEARFARLAEHVEFLICHASSRPVPETEDDSPQEAQLVNPANYLAGILKKVKSPADANLSAFQEIKKYRPLARTLVSEIQQRMDAAERDRRDSGKRRIREIKPQEIETRLHSERSRLHKLYSRITDPEYANELVPELSDNCDQTEHNQPERLYGPEDEYC